RAGSARNTAGTGRFPKTPSMTHASTQLRAPAPAHCNPTRTRLKYNATAVTPAIPTPDPTQSNPNHTGPDAPGIPPSCSKIATSTGLTAGTWASSEPSVSTPPAITTRRTSPKRRPLNNRNTDFARPPPANTPLPPRQPSPDPGSVTSTPQHPNRPAGCHLPQSFTQLLMPSIDQTNHRHPELPSPRPKRSSSATAVETAARTRRDLIPQHGHPRPPRPTPSKTDLIEERTMAGRATPRRGRCPSMRRPRIHKPPLVPPATLRRSPSSCPNAGPRCLASTTRTDQGHRHRSGSAGHSARRADATGSDCGCGGRATATRGDKSMNYYPLLIALGLLFLAASFLVMHRTGRIALVVLSCVAFLVAAILTVVGTAGVPGG